LYHSYYEEGEVVITTNNTTAFTNSTGAKLTDSQLRVSIGSLFLIFLISFSIFMVKIDRKYVKTFFSTETGHAKAKRQFLEGKDDFAKSQIVRRNKRLWTSIRPRVAEWLDANWDHWESEKPDWFNSVFIASVDDDIMPKRALAAEKQKAAGSSRRRSSLLDHISIRALEELEGEAAVYDSDEGEVEDEDEDENEQLSMRAISQPEVEDAEAYESDEGEVEDEGFH
jgi:hypothetical protein